MATLTNSGRAAIAVALTSQPLFLAWGSGDPAWDSNPIPEPVTATGLVAELGRRAATSWQFVTPNANGTGSITVPEGNFDPSATPTGYILLQFNFAYADAATSQLREIGVFTNTVLNSGLPAGQTYFAPTDLQSPGLLYCLQYFPVITRSANTQQSFQFVLAT